MKSNSSIQDAFFESWKRHNAIVHKVAKTLDAATLAARATPTSPTVAEQLAEMHITRTQFLQKIAPEFATKLAKLWWEEGDGWAVETDKKKILAALKKSEVAVADAVQARSLKKKSQVVGLDGVYSHPVHFLQHMMWHEAYHLGQIMLALKVHGTPMDEDTQQKAVWKVWKS